MVNKNHALVVALAVQRVMTIVIFPTLEMAHPVATREVTLTHRGNSLRLNTPRNPSKASVYQHLDWNAAVPLSLYHKTPLQT